MDSFFPKSNQDIFEVFAIRDGNHTEQHAILLYSIDLQMSSAIFFLILHIYNDTTAETSFLMP